MLIWVLRGLFVVLVASIAYTAFADENEVRMQFTFMLAAIAVSVAFIVVDVLLPRKSLAALSGAFLGLVVGIVAAWGLGLIVDLMVETFFNSLADRTGALTGRASGIVGAIKLMVGTICCYMTISFILQTKDDIRFVIPYVEFSRQTRGARPLLYLHPEHHFETHLPFLQALSAQHRVICPRHPGFDGRPPPSDFLIGRESALSARMAVSVSMLVSALQPTIIPTQLPAYQQAALNLIETG